MFTWHVIKKAKIGMGGEVIRIQIWTEMSRDESSRLEGKRTKKIEQIAAGEDM